MSSQERDALVSAGWTDEGIGWYSSDDNRSFPLQRQYNPYAHTGTHNYTLNPGEASYLISRGRRDERVVAWYGIGGALFCTVGYLSLPEAPFKNCKAVRAAGRAPFICGDPGYGSKLDTADNDRYRLRGRYIPIRI
ncbi:MAG: excalibur calcium-binding domain-containing protein [Bifidobacterium dentium]